MAGFILENKTLVSEIKKQIYKRRNMKKTLMYMAKQR